MTTAFSLEQDSNLRPTRSRKDRPCDYCRQLKHSCHILVRGQPCVNCTKTSRECTFYEPPRKRKRDKGSIGTLNLDVKAGGGSGSSNEPSRPGSSQAQSTMRNPQSASVGGSSSRASSFQSLRRESSTRPGSAKFSRRDIGGSTSVLSSFLDSLDEEETAQQTLEDSIDYPSLDGENNDVEESHYLGSRAFAHLILSYPESGATISSNTLGTEELQYRQVADPKNPAYFLRNPSRIYGLSNHAFEAEKAYQMVYDMLRDVGSDYPHKMVQVFLRESLPAMPILNRARLQSACFNPQAPTPFPYTVLTGILTHASAHSPDLRLKIRELWKIVLSLEENEYRLPRLQTLQLTLLDIWGRPCSSPGHNHAALCRAIGAAQLLGLHRNCDRWKLPKWERSIRKRIWWTLYVFDKWNAFVYGRPSNIATHAVPIPTTRDADPGESLDVFIASCRLSCILDSLLPVLGSESLKEVDHRIAVHEAAKQMEDLDRVTNLKDHEPGACSYRLDYLGVQVLICRIGLDESGPLSAKQLEKVAVHVRGIAEGVADFLDNLLVEDCTAFWAPWSSYHISHTASLILQTCLKISRLSDDPGHPSSPAFNKLVILLKRILVTCQAQADGNNEVAESAIPRIRRLVLSVPGLEHETLTEIRTSLCPTPDLNQTSHDATTTEFPFDFASLLNSAEWLAPGLEWINDTSSTAALPVLPTSTTTTRPCLSDFDPISVGIPVPPSSTIMLPTDIPVSLLNGHVLGTDDGLPPVNAATSTATATRSWF